MRILHFCFVFLVFISIPLFAQQKTPIMQVLFDKSFNLIAEPDVNIFMSNKVSPDAGLTLSVWGWSQDGKVAITTKGLNEPCVVKAFILDMVTDKVLWSSFAYREVRYPNSEFYYADQFFEHEIDKMTFYQNFGKACAARGIEFIQSNFKKFRYDEETNQYIPSFEHNGQIFKVTVQTTHADNEDGHSVVKAYKVFIETQNKIKLLGEKTLSYEPYAVDDHVRAQGVFISPYGNRALIVISEVHYLAEEPGLFGSHLSIGFSAKKGVK